MIVVILKTHPIVKRASTNVDVELRMMIENLTEQEAEDLGQAIYEFARKMRRSATMHGYSIDSKEVVKH